MFLEFNLKPVGFCNFYVHERAAKGSHDTARNFKENVRNTLFSGTENEEGCRTFCDDNSPHGRYLPNDVCATFAKEKSKAYARRVSENILLTTVQTGKEAACLQTPHELSLRHRRGGWYQGGERRGGTDGQGKPQPPTEDVTCLEVIAEGTSHNHITGEGNRGRMKPGRCTGDSDVSRGEKERSSCLTTERPQSITKNLNIRK